MQSKPLAIGLYLALAGCTALESLSAVPWADATLQRLPAAATEERYGAIGPLYAPVLNQPGQPVGPVPMPEREALPPAADSTYRTLTLADLEQMALGANPSVARAGALVQAARGNWVQVGLCPNPVAGYEGQQIGSGGRAEQYGVFVGQEFVRGGKLRLSREAAAQEVLKAEHLLAAQQQRVLTDVRVAYYHVLIAERQAKLATELLGIAAESIKVAEALLKGMEVGRVDLVQAQLELGNAEILAQNSRNRYDAAWRNLATVVGNVHLAPQPLDGDVEAYRAEHTWELSRERLLSTSPEIAAAISEIERARWALQRAKVEKVPNVTVQGLVNWRDNGIGGGADGAVTVGVPLPLWDRNQGGVAQAQGQVVAAERALDQLSLSLENRLAPVYERYASALNQVNKYRGQLVPAAQQSLDLTRRLYQAGETPYLNLLTAQRSYSQTNLNYLESLRALRAAEAEIEGLMLSGSLENR